MSIFSKQILFLPAFQQFITASKTGSRVMPSGKKIRSGTIEQYRCAYLLLAAYEQGLTAPLRLTLLHRSTLKEIQKEKLYWKRIFKAFMQFLYKDKKCLDQYTASVCKIIKTFFNYLLKEKCLPVGLFHQQFRVPTAAIMPVVISPAQLHFLITNKVFEQSLSKALQRTKDIFVFGCTVGLRQQDLMRLKKDNVQFNTEGVSLSLHTQKTSTIVTIPLPEYAIAIYTKYKRKAGIYVLPRLSSVNLNKQVKQLIQKAGWNHVLPKIRHRQGEPFELKNAKGQSFCFYEHITAHTMRRTAITTLLLLGVDETAVRRISGHAPGSKEFYKYVGLVQEYLNSAVKNAHIKLLQLNQGEG